MNNNNNNKIGKQALEKPSGFPPRSGGGGGAQPGSGQGGCSRLCPSRLFIFPTEKKSKSGQALPRAQLGLGGSGTWWRWVAPGDAPSCAPGPAPCPARPGVGLVPPPRHQRGSLTYQGARGPPALGPDVAGQGHCPPRAPHKQRVTPALLSQPRFALVSVPSPRFADDLSPFFIDS